MLTRLCRLGLEVTHPEAARSFYETRLGLTPTAESETAVSYGVGETTLVLRRPRGSPRGGVHTHYAFATTRGAYADWLDALSDLDPEEFVFGNSRSLYVYDPDGNCVEIGGVVDESATADESTTGEVAANGESTTDEPTTDEGSTTTDEPTTPNRTKPRSTPPPLSGVFEVVLEVTDLERAEAQFRALGFEVVDRGETRPRVRLAGPVDLELWEPQLGIADARGGLHVDLAFETADPAAAVHAGGPWAEGPEAVERGLRVRDADGHVLTFLTDC